MGRTYRTAQGKSLDLEKLKLQNELVPAVGNMQVNARGDQLGSGGQVVKTREDMVDQHYQSNVAKRRNVAKEDVIPTRAGKASDIEPTPQPAPAPVEEKKKQPKVEPTNAYEFTGDNDEASAQSPNPQADAVTGVAKGESSLKGGLARAVAKTREYEDKKNKPKRI